MSTKTDVIAMGIASVTNRIRATANNAAIRCPSIDKPSGAGSSRIIPAAMMERAIPGIAYLFRGDESMGHHSRTGKTESAKNILTKLSENDELLLLAEEPKAPLNNGNFQATFNNQLYVWIAIINHNYCLWNSFAAYRGTALVGSPVSPKR